MVVVNTVQNKAKEIMSPITKKVDEATEKIICTKAYYEYIKYRNIAWEYIVKKSKELDNYLSLKFKLKDDYLHIKRMFNRHKKTIKKLATMAIFGSLYIGGSLKQIIMNFQGRLVHTTNNPFFIMFFFGTLGITYAAVTYMIMTVFGVRLLHGMRIPAIMDARGFEISTTSTYGNSHFMVPGSKERTDLFLETDSKETYENILGKNAQGEAVSIRSEYELPNRHKLICGGSGSRKTVSQAIPEIMQSMKRGESVIVTDPKGDIYSRTYQMAKRLGYKVKVFNLKEPLVSDSINILKFIEQDTKLARTFVDILIVNSNADGKGKGDVWENGERGLILFGCLYVKCHLDIPEEEKTLPYVYNFLTTTPYENILSIVNGLPKDSAARKAFAIFLQAPENLRGSIFSGISSRLQSLIDEKIQAITQYDEIDLLAPGTEKCLYYVIIDDQDDSLNYYAALLFSFLFIKLTRFADLRDDERLPVPVNFLLDEFANIGKVPNFPTKLATIRSRDINCTIILQDIAQLKEMYPGAAYTSIVSNCSIAILLGTNDSEETALFWSNKLGTMTVIPHSESEHRTTGFFSKVFRNREFKQTQGEGKRQLMLPEELTNMPNNRCIVSVQNNPPIMLEKFGFWEHEMAEMITKENPIEHVPDWWSIAENAEWINKKRMELQKEVEYANSFESTRDKAKKERAAGSGSSDGTNEDETIEEAMESIIKARTEKYEGDPIANEAKIAEIVKKEQERAEKQKKEEEAAAEKAKKKKQLMEEARKAREKKDAVQKAEDELASKYTDFRETETEATVPAEGYEAAPAESKQRSRSQKKRKQDPFAGI